VSPHIVCGCQIVAFSDRIRYAVPHIVCGSRIHVHCAAFTPAAPQDHEERKKNKKKKNKKDKKRNPRPSDSEEDRKKKKQEKKERKKKREDAAVDDEAIADAIVDADAARYDQQGNVESRSPAYNADALAVAVPSPEEVADAACADITEPIRKGEVYRAALQAAQVAADGPAPETPALAAKSKSMKR
jgi:hypothetical protein